MSVVKGPFQGSQELSVYAGDATLYFEYGRRYPWSYLKQVFRERIRRCPACSHPYELFPGLVLQGDDGKLWNVQLQVTLVPAKPEVANGSVRVGGEADEVPEVRGHGEPFPKRGGAVQRLDQGPRKREVGVGR